MYGLIIKDGGLLTCRTLEPEFEGSIPAEAVGFFRCGKNPQACLPSEGK
jgi:hypothetical protein